MLTVPLNSPPPTVVTVTPETMLPSLEPLAEADSRSNPSLRSTGGRGLTISLEDPTCKMKKMFNFFLSKMRIMFWHIVVFVSTFIIQKLEMEKLLIFFSV